MNAIKIQIVMVTMKEIKLVMWDNWEGPILEKGFRKMIFELRLEG